MNQPTAEERQAALDNIDEADLAKIQAKIGTKVKVEQEDIVEAEFLMKFGFEAYWALYPEKDRKNGIDGVEMARILTASRKIDNMYAYLGAQSSFIGSAASKGKSPSSLFKKLTAKLLKSTKADS